jgi:hypothetical protein
LRRKEKNEKKEEEVLEEKLNEERGSLKELVTKF